ncbi:unnamed protein product [Heligmosomoides polygyrus]|uniref:Apple domain-containing protein n=1 Tax=Heligmosomoides polygyrus TaxID=6339 RepID=A0A183G5H7_HELPZ|nr:unnamed protein product [Heligmosomoides polygyrus]
MASGAIANNIERDRLLVNDEITSEESRYILLPAANAVKCNHFCRLYDYGTCKSDYVYVVMTFLRKDLRKLQADMRERECGFSTALRLPLQAFNAI